MTALDTLSNANWDNLLELYNNVHIHNQDVHHTAKPLSSYTSSRYGWPNFSILTELDVNAEAQFSEINEAIQQNEVAPLILVHPDLLNESRVTELFEKHEIRQIGQWPLIYYDLNDQLPVYGIPEGFRIVYVDSDKILGDWHAVASEVLFNKRPIPLHYEDSNKHFLFVAYENEKPVASVSAYFGINDSSAHMGAVLPEYRKKGYGKLITRAALQVSAEKGYRYCFSQSSKMGLKSWLNLGYKVSGYVNIFWKLGY